MKELPLYNQALKEIKQDKHWRFSKLYTIHKLIRPLFYIYI